MRCGGGDGVEDLATGGLLAHKVVPSSFPRQSGSSRPPPPATGLWDVVAPICRGLEACERLLRRFGCYCRRTHHCDQTLGGTRRCTRPCFSISLGQLGGLAAAVGYPLLFWRLLH